MYIQHLWVKYPTHNDHRDQTTKDHTWPPHVELLGHGQNYECYQEFQQMEINHHGGKKFRIQPRKNPRKSSHKFPVLKYKQETHRRHIFRAEIIQKENELQFEITRKYCNNGDDSDVCHISSSANQFYNLKVKCKAKTISTLSSSRQSLHHGWY